VGNPLPLSYKKKMAKLQVNPSIQVPEAKYSSNRSNGLLGSKIRWTELAQMNHSTLPPAYVGKRLNGAAAIERLERFEPD